MPQTRSRKVVAALVAIVLVSGLGGCSNSGEADDRELVLVAGQPSEGFGRRSVDDSVGFGFEGEEITAPGPTISVKAGEPVTITLKNDHYRNDIPFNQPHDFAVVADETDFVPEPLWNSQTEEIVTGESTSVTFVPDTPGTYSFVCTVGGHRSAGMFGDFIVEE